jgi:hypothetical protein
MRFMLEYPVAHSSYREEFLDPDVMSALAVSAECAGFAAIGFTDHPAPSEKWMRGRTRLAGPVLGAGVLRGGHHEAAPDDVSARRAVSQSAAG